MKPKSTPASPFASAPPRLLATITGGDLASDLVRVEAAILATRAKGIDAKAAGASTKTSPGFLKKRPYVYETVGQSASIGNKDELMFPGMPPVDRNPGEDDKPA